MIQRLLRTLLLATPLVMCNCALLNVLAPEKRWAEEDAAFNRQVDPVRAAWVEAAIAFAHELDDGHTDVRTIADAAMASCREYKAEMWAIHLRTPLWRNHPDEIQVRLDGAEDLFADALCAMLLRDRKAAAIAALTD